MTNAWGLSFGTAWNISWGFTSSAPPIPSTGICVELREDGGKELREASGYELEEFCAEVEVVGGGYTGWEGLRFWVKKNEADRQRTITEAATRLGRKGGIAS